MIKRSAVLQHVIRNKNLIPNLGFTPLIFCEIENVIFNPKTTFPKCIITGLKTDLDHFLLHLFCYFVVQMKPVFALL